ncbi:DUF5305 family protein [Sporosarcina oncorhynchi]|uniref:DUF5305 family protein n=1 Tax=Sporosarcina oncorhynchi TaxID=3056444 RepID=A0ABZ0L6C1_9BACL|nr:DUF5305 family protein [Sporosarcina sp. T2O-4]WOV88111.1 DUF5305 family protein [Sporosarcina sp. T2O-4]
MKKAMKIWGGTMKTTSHVAAVILLAVTLVVCIYSFTKPVTVTMEENSNQAKLETNYTYEATVTPNVLYPAGGTIQAGESMIKKITTAIPVTMNTKIVSEKEVAIHGTHRVEMTVIAEDLWEKTFPLEEQQTFNTKGSTIDIIDGKYIIDLVKISNFLTQVEDETGISSSKYTVEIQPNVSGTISYGGQEMPIEMTDKLVFQYTFDSIVLMSEKGFTSSLAFGTSEAIVNMVSLFGLLLPIGLVRTVSSILALLILSLLVYLNKNVVNRNNGRKPTEMELIHKKYGKRIIAVVNHENRQDKSVITLTAFTSVLAISDEKELPIFFCEITEQNRGIYFLIDGTSCYEYELQSVREETSQVKKWIEGVDVYARN